MTNWPQILTFKEKHGDYTYLIESLEDLDRTARGIVVERAKYGWYYEPDPYTPSQEDLDLLETSEEDLAKLPDSVSGPLLEKRQKIEKRVERRAREYQEESAGWKLVQAIKDNPDESTLAETPRGTKYSQAFNFLLSRRDWEYEGFEIQEARRWGM